MENILETLIKVIPAVLSVLLVVFREISNYAKNKVNEKMRVNAEEIAIVVEALYDGFPSSEKLDAFKKLCEQKRIDVEKAVVYLETKIIPITKYINSYIIKKKDDKEKGVTD